ncbi:MAG: hypothetical protein JWM56_721 [Candidatus Peribacteria bacterium]|nr:hypothetical protein [Candidatus Peribacteria bacterium]
MHSSFSRGTAALAAGIAVLSLSVTSMAFAEDGGTSSSVSSSAAATCKTAMDTIRSTTTDGTDARKAAITEWLKVCQSGLPPMRMPPPTDKPTAPTQPMALPSCDDMLKYLTNMKDSGKTGEDFTRGMKAYQERCINITSGDSSSSSGPAPTTPSFNGDPCTYVQKIIDQLTASLAKEPGSKGLQSQLDLAQKKLATCGTQTTGGNSKKEDRPRPMNTAGTDDTNMSDTKKPMPPMAGNCDQLKRIYEELSAKMATETTDTMTKRMTELKSKMARCAAGPDASQANQATSDNAVSVACTKKGALITCDDGFVLDLRKMMRPMPAQNQNDSTSSMPATDMPATEVSPADMTVTPATGDATKTDDSNAPGSRQKGKFLKKVSGRPPRNR